ncbi:MAG: rhomboid family intramembrane serine protease [Opitutaceae bacterium]|nr:rhomboid family intramembrane serine protease [Opitutaceae bacterium]
MLFDRSYMRDSYPRPTTSVLVWLICAITAMFLLENVFLRWFGAGDLLVRFLALSVPALQAGRVWTLVTYSFLHSTSNLLHIVANLLALYFLGRELLPLLGSRRFMGLYGAAVVIGGLAWAASNWQQDSTVIGASAGIAALLVVFACFYPNQQMTFLLFFILPVTMKPKYVAIGALAIDLGGFLFYEVMGAVSPFGFAHSAHLGGMAVGWLYFRYVHGREWSLLSRRTDIELPRWMRKGAKSSAAAPAYRVDLSNRNDLRAEVDRILDKINSQGFGALTAEEKRVLDDAKHLLSQR